MGDVWQQVTAESPTPVPHPQVTLQPWSTDASLSLLTWKKKGRWIPLIWICSFSAFIHCMVFSKNTFWGRHQGIKHHFAFCIQVSCRNRSVMPYAWAVTELASWQVSGQCQLARTMLGGGWRGGERGRRFDSCQWSFPVQDVGDSQQSRPVCSTDSRRLLQGKERNRYSAARLEQQRPRQPHCWHSQGECFWLKYEEVPF